MDLLQIKSAPGGGLSPGWRIRKALVTPITADGTDWAAAAKLRDKVRAEILKHCGEPDQLPRS